MSDLLYNVSQVRKSLQKKRLIRNKELSLNFTPLPPFDTDRSKTERYRLRQDKSQNSEIGLTSPSGPKRFEFLESLTSPSRVRSYKIDAANLLVSRLKRFFLKHFIIWKENMEALRNEENNIFHQKAWRLKVSVGRPESRFTESVTRNHMAGKIVRKSQDNIAKIISKITSSLDLDSEDDAPIIEDKKMIHASSIDNLNFFHGDKVPLKRIVHPKINLQTKNNQDRLKEKAQQRIRERAAKKLLDFLRNKVKSLFGAFVRKEIDGKKMKTFFEGLLISRFKIIYSTISFAAKNQEPESRVNDSKSNRKNFEGCLLNIRKFIDEKRDKKEKRNSVIPLSTIEAALEKLFFLTRKCILSQFFLFLHEYSFQKGFIFFEKILTIAKTHQTSLLTASFNLIQLYPKTLSNHTKILKLLLKNLKKDCTYRIKTCFKFWRSATSQSIKQLEFTSLSAITVHNILLNLINCKTKMFFTTCTLALNKFKHLTQEKYSNIQKAANRLSLCIRDKQFKPFTLWKYNARAYKSRFLSRKPVFFRMERRIMLMVNKNMRDAFSSILIYIKQKQSAIRLINKFFKKYLQVIFTDFHQKTKISDKVKSPLFPISKTIGTLLSRYSRITDSHSQFRPRKFTFKYLCNALNKLANNLSFHHNSLKKNTIRKWRVYSMNAGTMHLIKLKYNRDVRQALACSNLFKATDMLLLSSIRFSFIKLLKY